MQALPQDVISRVGSNLTRLELYLGVTDWTTSAIRFGTLTGTPLFTAEALKEWCQRMGFQPQLRVITTMYSWTATQYWYHDDLAVTARLGSMAKTWVRRMLALAKQDISINTADVAKLSGSVGKKFDWHKSAGLERIYTDVGLFQFMRALRIKTPISLR